MYLCSDLIKSVVPFGITKLQDKLRIRNHGEEVPGQWMGTMGRRVRRKRFSNV